MFTVLSVKCELATHTTMHLACTGSSPGLSYQSPPYLIIVLQAITLIFIAETVVEFEKEAKRKWKCESKAWNQKTLKLT